MSQEEPPQLIDLGLPRRGEPGVCMSAYVAEYVSMTTNAAGRAAAMDYGDDYDAYSGVPPTPEAEAAAMERAAAANREWDIRFKPATYGCLMCKGTVELEQSGRVDASDCLVTGSCEQIWATMHPEQYQNPDGTPQIKRLPCGGFKCKAALRLTTRGKPKQLRVGVDGDCTVDVEGERWRTTGRAALDRMKPVDPEDGIEVFDGQRFAGDGIE